MTTTERHTVPPIECMPWCVDGDGHPDDIVAEDQNCYGPRTYVDLTVEPEADVGYPAQVGVMAYRHNGERAAIRLHVMVEAIDVDPLLTAAEARELAAGLLRVADQIEQVQR